MLYVNSNVQKYPFCRHYFSTYNLDVGYVAMSFMTKTV